MEELITLLLHLVQKVPYLSEVERDVEMDLLRAVQEKLGVDGGVPPKPGPTNAPPADAPPPPVPPEVGGTVPESTNAFSSLVSDLSPAQVQELKAALANAPS